MSDPSSTSPSALERLVRSRWYGAGGIQGLSKLSGVSRATMYSWFRGETVPDTKSLARLASVLDLSVADLIAAIEPGEESATHDPAPMQAQPAAYLRRAFRTQTLDEGAANPPRQQWPKGGAPTIASVLPRAEVMWASADEPIGPVAQTMYDRHFSQAPVRDGGEWIALLTTEAIARWMAGRSRHQLDVEARAPVREVLAYADDAADFRVVPPDLPASEVIALFDRSALAGQPLKAVLVAGSRREESLDGIVTVADLPLLRRIGSR